MAAEVPPLHEYTHARMLFLAGKLRSCETLAAHRCPFFAASGARSAVGHL